MRNLFTVGSVNPASLSKDDELLSNLEDRVRDICRAANATTSAPIGVTWAWLSKEPPTIKIQYGRRARAALPLELGTKWMPARRPVKQALDRFRSG